MSVTFSTFIESTKSEEAQSENCYFYLKIKSTVDTFYSNIFRMHDQINDIFQFELNNILINDMITLNLELYKLTNFVQTKLVSVGVLTLNFADFYANNRKTIVNLSGSSYNSTLKIRYRKLNTPQSVKNFNNSNSMLKLAESSLFSNDKIYHFISEIYLSHDLEGTIDLEKLEAVVDPLFELKINDFSLIRKILILFSHLNTKPLYINRQDTDRDLKRIVKNRVAFKLYELLIRLISQLDSVEHLEYFYTDIATTNLNDNILHPKQIVLCIINILRDLFDSDLFTSITYDLTLEYMDFLIKMLVDLSKLTSKSSLYELKYSLNDLILNKLVKQIRQSQIKMYLAYCKLNLRFLNYLYISDEFFNGYELAVLSIKLLSLDGSSGNSNADLLNENVISSIINLFNLDLFQNNFQFRDRVIEHLLNSYFLNVDKILVISSNSTASCNIRQMLRLVRVVLKNKLKLNKANFETFLKFALTFLIDSQLVNMKSFESIDNHDRNHTDLVVEIEDSASSNGEIHILSDNSSCVIDTFLCLIEIIDHIMINVSCNSINTYFDNKNLKSVFDIIIFYFKYGCLLSLKYKFKLTLNIELIILKFVKYIQKFLFKYLIAKQFDNQITPNDTEDRTPEEAFIIAYFDMIFVFVEQNNINSFTYYLKNGYMQAAHQFWSDLNMKLKRSNILNEYLIRNTVKCLIINCYFKRDIFEIDHKKTDTTLPIFISRKSVEEFNRTLFGFLCDIVNIDHMYLNCVCLSLIEYVIKYDKYKRSYSKKLMSDFDELNNLASATVNLNDTENIDENNLILANYNEHHDSYIFGLKCCSRLVYNYLNDRECNSALGAIVFERLRLGFDYNFLKEFYERENSISIVERYLFVYDLLKLVEKLTLGKDQMEPKRKIKIYLLGNFHYFNHF